MTVFKRGIWWWYELMYQGVRIRASSKSTDRKVAERPEIKKRWELDHPDDVLSAESNEPHPGTFLAVTADSNVQ